MGRAVLQYSHCTSDTTRRQHGRAGAGRHAGCGARPRRTAGLQAVHLVHSSCF